MRNLLVLIIAVIVLALVNFEIYQKEQLLAEGTTVLLELAPRDPRSIMQGDYMVLRYHIARLPALSKVEKDGYLVIERDENKLPSFPEFMKKVQCLKPMNRYSVFVNGSVTFG